MPARADDRTPLTDTLRRTPPGDAAALFRAGAAAVRGGEEQAALPLLRATVQRHPREAKLWQVLGLALRALDRAADAADAFARAAKLAPGDALIAHSLARCRLEAGLPAVEAFGVAARMAPVDGGVLLGQAAARLAAGDPAGAERGLAEVLALEPRWLDGQATLARLRHMAGDPEPLRSYRAALAAQPREPALWGGFLDTLVAAERFAELRGAVADARRALGEGEALDLYDAIAADETGDVVGAEALFRRLGGSDRPAIVVRSVRHLIRRGDLAAAARLAEAHVAGSRELWPYLALTWRALGNPRHDWLEGEASFVRVIDLGDAAGDLARLADRLRALHVATHQPIDQSVRGGTQTDGPLLSRSEPEIVALRDAIRTAVEAYAAALPDDYPDAARHPLLAARPARVRFAGSWSVRLTGGGFHADHVHPQGWVSSALYVALPQAGAGEAGWLTLGAASALLPELAPFRTIEPRPGRLVLFPSFMWHGTRKFAAGERLTVAFDVAPGGQA